MRLGLGLLDGCAREGFLMGEPFRTRLRLVGGGLVDGFGDRARVEADERVMRFGEEVLGSKA